MAQTERNAKQKAKTFVGIAEVQASGLETLKVYNFK